MTFKRYHGNRNSTGSFSKYWIFLFSTWCFSEVLEKINDRSKMAALWPLKTRCNSNVIWRHQFWTYYLLSNFRCHSFNILGVKVEEAGGEGGGHGICLFWSQETKESPVWAWIGLKPHDKGALVALPSRKELLSGFYFQLLGELLGIHCNNWLSRRTAPWRTSRISHEAFMLRSYNNV